LTRPVGGAATQVESLDEALCAIGIESQIACGVDTLGEGDVLSSTRPRLTIVNLRRQIHPVRDLLARREIARVLRVHAPSVVHSHQAKAGAIIRPLARRRGIATVHTFHGYAIDEIFPPTTARAFLAAERILARATDALIAPTQRLRDELVDRGIGKAERWHVIPYGVDPAAFAPMPRDEARRNLALPAGGSIVGIVGRVAPVKDHRLFIEVASRVASADPNVLFVVAGDGELRDELERFGVERLGTKIRFLGHVQDTRSLYSSIDVLVLTSRTEGTPVSLLEAGSAHVPSVATDVGSVSEVAADGITGYVVPRDDVDLLAQRVVGLLGDADRRRAMGAEAARVVQERFSIERLAAQTAALYVTLI
jgi:glycosyltransferase involved in cell wall biosynthesis